MRLHRLWQAKPLPITPYDGSLFLLGMPSSSHARSIFLLKMRDAPFVGGTQGRRLFRASIEMQRQRYPL